MSVDTPIPFPQIHFWTLQYRKVSFVADGDSLYAYLSKMRVDKKLKSMDFYFFWSLINPHQRCGYSDSPFARKDTFLYCRVQKGIGRGGSGGSVKRFGSRDQVGC